MQLKDDWMILDKSVADQVSMWKSSKGFTDKVISDHECSGDTCSYYQIGDVFVCENTGYIHGKILFFVHFHINSDTWRAKEFSLPSIFVLFICFCSV